MKIIINRNNNKWKDIYGNKVNIRYLPYNKNSNIIYMVNSNLLLNILNEALEYTDSKRGINLTCLGYTLWWTTCWI